MHVHSDTPETRKLSFMSKTPQLSAKQQNSVCRLCLPAEYLNALKLAVRMNILLGKPFTATVVCMRVLSSHKSNAKTVGRT